MFGQYHSSKSRIVSDVQIAEIRRLLAVVDHKDEFSLRNYFDFPAMTDFNVQMYAHFLSPASETSISRYTNKESCRGEAGDARI